MKNTFVIIFIVLISFTVKAQYDGAMGLKLNDYKIAVNYKKFLSDSTNTLLDLELGFQETGVEFIGLYNWQVPFVKVSNLYWYYGVGMNLGRWNDHLETRLSIGVDAQVGLEYVPAEVPLAFSLDYTPNFSVASIHNKVFDTRGIDKGFWARNWTVGVKYTFGKSSK